ncbi:hypothetical protein PRIPAC_87250 [Pristionchus pacificus]|uniref:Uncharacterized protein n=1 Tax=Pristionchus pacificus TaxID=54126 RepID=A0A2A6CX78_PRIPA|nr:hypothetical protein PRIPAC_87250 [Pristionchus pacificus]|eukprot:PDM82769.1 hypothetical protein PRIPAC_37162 [Pristionchus pacificus]
MDTADYVWLFIFLGIFALAIIVPCVWCMCYKCRTRGPITPLPADYPRQETMPMMGTLSDQ